jgi:hypothetical protein
MGWTKMTKELATAFGRLINKKCECGEVMALAALHEHKTFGKFKEFKCFKCGAEEMGW